MNPRTTLVLAIVAAVLGGLIYFYEIRGAPSREEAAEAEGLVFPGTKPSDVLWVEIETEDGYSARVERTDDASGENAPWRVTAPIEFPADEVTADGLARAIATLAREREFDDPAALEEYGLEGEARLRFATEAGEHTVYVGADAPFGDVTYLSIDDRTRIFAVANTEVAPFEPTLKALRDRRIAVFDADAIDAVEVAWPTARARGERDGERWVLREPLETGGDRDAIEGLISQIEFLRTVDFVDAPGEAELATLAAPDLRVVLSSEKGEEVALDVGVPVGDRRLLRIAGRDTLFSMPATLLDDFPEGPVALRDRKLGRFSTLDAASFELALEDPDRAQTFRVTATKESTRWSTQPAMQPGKASRLVSELAGLEAQDVLAESMGEGELRGLGLAPPRVALRVEGGQPEEDGAKPAVLAELEFGTPDPERGIPARIVGSDTVYWVEPELADVMPVNVEAFENRFASKEAKPESEVDEAPEAAN